MSNNKAIKFLQKDPKMAEIIEQVGEYKVKITKNRYQSLVEEIGNYCSTIIRLRRRIYLKKIQKIIQIKIS